MSVCKCGHVKVFHMLNGKCARFITKVTLNPVTGERRSFSVQCKCKKYEERGANDLRRD